MALYVSRSITDTHSLQNRLLKFSQTCDMTKWKWKEVLADLEMEQGSGAQSEGRPHPKAGGSLCFDKAWVRAGGAERVSVCVQGAKGPVCTH